MANTAATTRKDVLWWHELNCWDAQAAMIFYARMLGWQFETLRLPGGERYHVAWRQGRPLCGILELNAALHAGIPAHWMTYLAVDDLNACLKETARAGGRTVRTPVTLPSVGRLAVVVDATDALIGFIEPAADHPLRAGETEQTMLPQGHALQA